MGSGAGSRPTRQGASFAIYPRDLPAAEAALLNNGLVCVDAVNLEDMLGLIEANVVIRMPNGSCPGRFESHQLGTLMPVGGHPLHQIQALDRTQPGLPLKKGRAGTMTHDYKRHGTTTLFAALNILDGTVLGRCMQRHRHQEFIRFLNAIEEQVRAVEVVHVILDNYAAKSPSAGLARPPPVLHLPRRVLEPFRKELSRGNRS